MMSNNDVKYDFKYKISNLGINRYKLKYMVNNNNKIQMRCHQFIK